jgi:hypothetical protein
MREIMTKGMHQHQEEQLKMKNMRRDLEVEKMKNV